MLGGGGGVDCRDMTRTIQNRKKLISPQKKDARLISKNLKSWQIKLPEDRGGINGYRCMCVCAIVFESVYGCFQGGAGVCGLSVYLSGGTPHRPQQFQA